MTDVPRLLTRITLVLPTLLAGSLAGMAVAGGRVFDRLTPVLFLVWIAATPVLAITTLRQRSRLRDSRLVVLNVVALSLWAIGLVVGLLLH